ncbi:MAG: hypothetical protein P8X42_12735 [Calditrichaceae bacterium]|jgi:hypothetical protein
MKLRVLNSRILNSGFLSFLDSKFDFVKGFAVISMFLIALFFYGLERCAALLNPLNYHNTITFKEVETL